MMKRKVGAPKGGRVHWLLFHLPADFKGAYVLEYNYDKHNYVFYRKKDDTLFDIFVVWQSSVHYWRAVYSLPAIGKYVYFGYKNTEMIACYMYELYLENNIS